MTPADWQALAARFEAATDETIYECVLRLVEAVPHPERGRLIVAINGAKNARLPDLLLGVVVACVPEGWICAPEWGKRGAWVRMIQEGDDGDTVDSQAATNVTALGAAVCRAWEAVDREKEAAAVDQWLAETIADI